MAYFEINNLVVKHKSYEGVKTVLDIDHLEIRKGETYGIVGESGQGKTVLALTILQLLQTPPGIIEKGEILLDGEDLLKKSVKEMQHSVRGGKVAMIFQDPMSCLNPVFTVGSTMIDVLRRHNRGMSKKAAQTEAIHLLEEVKLADAESIMAKYPHQLSGGQRQRVIIALALCCGAEFMIADEPTRNLDVTIQASVLKLLKDLQRSRNITVLFIANNMSLVSAFCDRVAILRDSRIVEDDIKKQKNLTLKAVDDVSFRLRQGEVLGIVGESGCGKSTLVNTILNLFEPTDGKVYFEGVDVFGTAKKSGNAFKKNVQIVFQDPYWSLNPRWLIKDIVAEPLDVYEKMNETQRLARVKELLSMVGIPEDACFKYPHEFSGGQRQRIAIARSLASNPKLVVLDEPTSSIDVFSQAQILELIKDLRRRFNLTNILISHDLGVVHELSNKIAVMYLGHIVEMGPAEEVFNHPRHPYTQALFDSIPSVDTIGINSLKTLEGQIPSPINPPSGCPFHTRCARACEACSRQVPAQTMVGEDHMVSCLLFEQKEDGQ